MTDDDPMAQVLRTLRFGATQRQRVWLTPDECRGVLDYLSLASERGVMRRDPVAVEASR